MKTRNRIKWENGPLNEHDILMLADILRREIETSGPSTLSGAMTLTLDKLEGARTTRAAESRS